MSRRVRVERSIEGAFPVVWEVLTDLRSYGDWNPFLTRAEPRGPLAAGTLVDVRAQLGPARSTVAVDRVTHFRPPADGRGEIAWQFHGWMSRLGLLRVHRIQTLEAVEDGRVLYVSDELFSGVFAAFAPVEAIRKMTRFQADAFEREVVRRGTISC